MQYQETKPAVGRIFAGSDVFDRPYFSHSGLSVSLPAVR